MIKLTRHYNVIISYIEGSLTFNFQIQYYNGGDYVSEKHWGISFGPWWPPFVTHKPGAE